MVINILGTAYTIEYKSLGEDSFLEKCDGYCDKTSKNIVVVTKSESCELDNFDACQKKVLRHEIIHGFLFESGLHENWNHDMGHDETYVDWIAAQYPKLKAAFMQAGCDE